MKWRFWKTLYNCYSVAHLRQIKHRDIIVLKGLRYWILKTAEYLKRHNGCAWRITKVGCEMGCWKGSHCCDSSRHSLRWEHHLTIQSHYRGWNQSSCQTILPTHLAGKRLHKYSHTNFHIKIFCHKILCQFQIITTVITLFEAMHVE